MLRKKDVEVKFGIHPVAGEARRGVTSDAPPVAWWGEAWACAPAGTGYGPGLEAGSLGRQQVGRGLPVPTNRPEGLGEGRGASGA